MPQADSEQQASLPFDGFAPPQQPNGQHLSLVARLCAIMGSLPELPKAGYNKHHAYNYVIADDVSQLLQKRLAMAGIIIIPSASNVRRTDLPGKDGKAGQVLTSVDMGFQIVCAFSGEQLSATWAGDGADNQDKGLNKALTAGLKTWLQKTFLMNDGEGSDPEWDGGAAAANKKAKDTPAADRATKPPPAPSQDERPKRSTPPPPKSDDQAEDKPKKPPAVAALQDRITAALDKLGLDMKTHRGDVHAHLLELEESVPGSVPTDAEGRPNLKTATVPQLRAVAEWFESKVGLDEDPWGE